MPRPETSIIFRPTREHVVALAGEKCGTYEAGCPVCDTWKRFETDGTMTAYVETDTFVKFLLSEFPMTEFWEQKLDVFVNMGDGRKDGFKILMED